MGNRVSAGIPLFCDDGSMVIEPTGRISAVGGGGGGAPTGPATGDLGGTYPGPQVVGLQTVPVSAVAPTAGQFLGYNGVSWIGTTVVIPTTLPPSGPASGDLSGSYPAPLVDGLQGRPVAATAPASGEVLAWDGAQWEPTAFTAGGVEPATPATVPLRTAAGGLRANALSADVGDLLVGFTTPAPAAPAFGGTVTITAQNANTNGEGGFLEVFLGDAVSPGIPRQGGSMIVALGASAGGPAPPGGRFQVARGADDILTAGIDPRGTNPASLDVVTGGNLLPNAALAGSVGAPDLLYTEMHAGLFVAHGDTSDDLRVEITPTSITAFSALAALGPLAVSARDTLLTGQWRNNVVTATFAAPTTTIDLDAGAIQRLVLTGDTTIDLTNFRVGGKFVLELVQDATGGRAVTWPVGIVWPNSVPPVLSRSPDARDTFVFYGDGTSDEPILQSFQIEDGHALGYQARPGNPFSGAFAITARVGDYLRGDPTGGAGTVTLPDASLLTPNHQVTWKSTTTSVDPVTFSVAGGGTIDAAASYPGILPRGMYTFVPAGDGTNAWDLAI